MQRVQYSLFHYVALRGKFKVGLTIAGSWKCRDHVE